MLKGSMTWWWKQSRVSPINMNDYNLNSKWLKTLCAQLKENLPFLNQIQKTYPAICSHGWDLGPRLPTRDNWKHYSVTKAVRLYQSDGVCFLGCTITGIVYTDLWDHTCIIHFSSASQRQSMSSASLHWYDDVIVFVDDLLVTDLYRDRLYMINDCCIKCLNVGVEEKHNTTQHNSVTSKQKNMKQPSACPPPHTMASVHLPQAACCPIISVTSPNQHITAGLLSDGNKDLVWSVKCK